MKAEQLKYWLSPLLIMLIVIGMVDIYQDLQQGGSLLHALLEVLATLVAALALLVLWVRIDKSMRREESRMQAMQSELQAYRQRHTDLLSQMRSAIHEQFNRWHFTPTESRIAEKLIRGYSIREIAATSNRSQRTVRNQATALYQKSGMLGRADLAAFFLEDIFPEEEQD